MKHSYLLIIAKCVISLCKELERGVPTAQRVRAMKELHEIVATKRLEEVANLIAAVGHVTYSQ